MSDQAFHPAVEEYLSGSIPEICRLFEQVAKRLRHSQRETIRRSNLTPLQYFILALPWQRSGRPWKELAAACECTPAPVTGTVDALEKKALVTRRPNPDDGRSVLVTLTQEGRALTETPPTLDGIFQDCCGVL